MVLVHMDFAGDKRAVGKSMIVGRMIFSIVEGLGCVGGQSHVFVQKLLVRPVPASHAEKASIRIGTRANDGVWFSTGQIERGMNMDSIMLSRHSRAEMRCVRWNASPRLLNVNAE